ncbi:MAG: cytochrome-c peroxidase [Bacteroidetes bacterium]|nr:cytochrome-c peroxidase [Bacteroidota bacterium]
MRLHGLLGIVFCVACSSPKTNAPYTFPDTPAGVVPQSESNKATEKGVELGKRLFFDSQLSSNGTVSCQTCHHPEKAFTDGQSLTSMGVSHKPLLRHAPALFNLAWYPGLFWDGGSKNLESQVFGPLTHPDEMGMDLTILLKKLRADKEYPKLFRDAFGEDSITTQGLARALAQYERTLLSFDSHYDRVKAGKENFTRMELEGEKLYTQFCASCHPAPLFTDLSYHANGIDSSISDKSHELIYWGRYRITNDSADIGKFKTPSLRNVGFTAPYMHDGRLASLDDVLNHYARNQAQNPLADERLKAGDFSAIGVEQKKALEAFLYALNDSTYIGN